jgi:hypothetical protein
MHRLLSLLWIDAGRPENHDFLDRRPMASSDGIHRNHRVLVQEIGLGRTIGMNSPDPRRRDDRHVWRSIGDETLGVFLSGEIELR